MRVLIPVDHAVGISGPHRNVVGSLNALGARGDVEVVLLTGMVDRTEPYASSPNVDVRLGFAPHDPKRIPQNLLGIQRAARGCDVIYVPSGLKAFLYAQTVRRGRRLVAGPNVTPLPIGKRHDSPGSLELRYMSDAWIEASRTRRDHVRRESGDLSVETLHHAIDSSKFSPDNADEELWNRLGVPAARVVVLYVGRDNESRKGVPQLVDAIDMLKHRGDLRFVLVGKMSEATRIRIAGLDNVSELGFRGADELPRLYASADMSVVPSSWENFPFTVMEAMASGLPVIGSRAGGIPEMIVHGETGLLVDIVAGGKHRQDAGEILADAIVRLADDEGLRKRLGSAARQRVLDHFSERRLGDDLANLFRDVTNDQDTASSHQ